MEYFNYLKSGYYVLIDRSSNFLNYYLTNDNDVDNNENQNQNVNNLYYKKRLFTPKSKIEQIQTFFSKPTHIIDNIYLGSAFNASHYDTLMDKNIGFIINMTSEISNYYENEILYKKYPLYDNNKESIKQYFEDAYEKIILFQSNNPSKNILVHCFMGASRSVSIVIYYLMKKHKMNLNDSIVFLKNKREIVNPTILFYNELSEVENNK
jgi:dual specificity MAP kinase phosphatase